MDYYQCKNVLDAARQAVSKACNDKADATVNVTLEVEYGNDRWLSVTITDDMRMIGSYDRGRGPQVFNIDAETDFASFEDIFRHPW